MNHFFLASDNIRGNQVIFPFDVAKQIRRVLRLQANDFVIVLDNAGKEYVTRIMFGDEMQVFGTIESVRDSVGEPTIETWLYLSLSQREKMEWVLQKGTELGMTGIIPIISERSLVQDQRIVEKKRERWERILKEAAEQSHRGRIPVLGAALKFAQGLADADQRTDLALIPSVSEKVRSLRTVLQESQFTKVGIFIGPEGGYSEKEIQQAETAQVIPVSLGSRVLRMETAAITSIALLQYQYGQLD